MTRKDQKLRLLLDVHNAQQVLYNAVSALGSGGAHEQCEPSVTFHMDATVYEVHNEFTSLFLFEHSVRRYYSGHYEPMSTPVAKKISNNGLRFGKEAQWAYDARLMRRR